MISDIEQFTYFALRTYWRISVSWISTVLQFYAVSFIWDLEMQQCNILLLIDKLYFRWWGWLHIHVMVCYEEPRPYQRPHEFSSCFILIRQLIFRYHKSESYLRRNDIKSSELIYISRWCELVFYAQNAKNKHYHHIFYNTTYLPIVLIFFFFAKRSLELTSEIILYHQI